MKYEQAKKLVRKNLSEKRYTHTKNVKKMAVKLAKRWGADPEKAALAAILHDAAKELPKDRQLQIFAENAIIAENAPLRPTSVWHGCARPNGTCMTRRCCPPSGVIPPASRG